MVSTKILSSATFIKLIKVKMFLEHQINQYFTILLFITVYFKQTF